MDVNEEQVIHIWDDVRLEDLYVINPPGRNTDLVCQYYLSQKGHRASLDFIEEEINRTELSERRLPEYQLFRTGGPHQTTVLEQCCEQGFFRSVNKGINNYIYRGENLFTPHYPTEEEYHFHIAEVFNREKGCWVGSEPPCPRQFANQIRNFQLFLRALIRHTLGIRETKIALLEELSYHSLEGGSEWTTYDDTLVTESKRQQYIKDLNKLKRFAVRLASYEEVLDRQRYYLTTRGAAIDARLKGLRERTGLGASIVDYIASYLSNEVYQLTEQQARENPHLRTRDADEYFFHKDLFHAEGDNTPLGNWAVSTLEKAYDTYSDSYHKHTPNYRVSFEDYSGPRHDFIGECMGDIKAHFSCLSFEYEVSDINGVYHDRNPWTDLFINRSVEVKTNDEDVELGKQLPIAWVDDILVATQFIPV